MRWLDELVAAGAEDPEALASASYVQGFLAMLQADAVAARPALVRAVAAARETGQLGLLCESLAMASMAEGTAGDRQAAVRSLEEARGLATRLDTLPAKLAVLQAQAINGLLEGDLEAVRSASSEGVQLSRQANDLHLLAFMLSELGGTALIAGDLDRSRPLYAEALQIAYRIDDRVGQFYFLNGLACIAAGSGQAELSARLLGAAETMRTSAGASVVPLLAGLLAQAAEAATAVLGPSRFQAEFNSGKSLSREAALALALGEPTPPAAGPARDGEVPMLPKREAEVAQLVAQGLSNKQIGARLFISERTVDSHIRSILNKLGFN